MRRLLNRRAPADLPAAERSGARSLDDQRVRHRCRPAGGGRGRAGETSAAHAVEERAAKSSARTMLRTNDCSRPDRQAAAVHHAQADRPLAGRAPLVPDLELDGDSPT